MSDPLLTIAVSTVFSNLDRALLITSSLPAELRSEIEVIVVCQKAPADRKIYDTRAEGITTIYSNDVGLSKSRNAAIAGASASSKYIWFLDDDVEIETAALIPMLDLLRTNRPDVLRVRVGSLEDRAKYYKRYKSAPKFRKLHLLQFSSIEIICRLSVLRENHIQFDERFGLGTRYPCCEENLFLLQVFRKASNFSETPGPGVYHSTDMSVRLAPTSEHYIARGYVLSHFPAPIAVAVSLRWIFRNSAQGLWRVARALAIGYIQGRRDALHSIAV